MKKQAFTLAEVLITLVIIGVIAALTIPTLLNNMRDEANIVALKKFYSETNQLLLDVAREDCGTIGTIEGCFTTESSMSQSIAKHFKTTKNCGFENKKCWSLFKENYDGSGNDIDYDAYYSSYYRFITSDGMSVLLYIPNPNCSLNWNANTDSPMNKYCGQIIVDINGFKTPNRSGKDIFRFAITSNKAPFLYPEGMKDFFPWQINGCQKSNPYGLSCAGRFMENGWKADYSNAAED